MRYTNLIILILTSFLLISCDNEELSKYINSLNYLRTQTEEITKVENYTQKDLETVNMYFSEISRLSYLLKNMEKPDSELENFLKTFPKYLFIYGFFKKNKSIKKFLTALVKDDEFEKNCNNIILPTKAWNQMMENSYDNGYFMGSDEMRTYPNSLEVIKVTLNKFNKGLGDKCMGAQI